NRGGGRLHVVGLPERGGEGALQLRHFALILGRRGSLRRCERGIGIRSDRHRLPLAKCRRRPATPPRQRRAIGSWRDEWTDAAATAETAAAAPSTGRRQRSRYAAKIPRNAVNAPIAGHGHAAPYFATRVDDRQERLRRFFVCFGR